MRLRPSRSFSQGNNPRADVDDNTIHAYTYSIVEKRTVEFYKKLVIEKGESEREFIKSCFWGGDRISCEYEYAVIQRELRKLSKI